MPSSVDETSGWAARLDQLFQDHELFLRTKGHVRFLKISARLQKRVAVGAALVLLIWLGVTIYMAAAHALGAGERAAAARQQAAAAAAEARIAKYRDRISEVAADLDARQEHLEQLQADHFGAAPPAQPDGPSEPDAASSPGAAPVVSTTPPPAAARPGLVPAATAKISLKSAAPGPAELPGKLPAEAAALARIDARQERLANRMLAAVNGRAADAAAAVRQLGMSPDKLVRDAMAARGGPFEPYRGRMGRSRALGPSFAALDAALLRMEALERAVLAVPSANPAGLTMISSNFGYRRDPFTGAAAMHSGVDFSGPIGTPILAAAAGRVSFVGVKSGYGLVIDVDHGQGITTRYAHLSGFDAKLGDQVAAGTKIARMGSTGRSTGSHLHFEVRINDVPVNPRRFLEVNDDVLEVQAAAAQRVQAVSRSQ